eukprot:8542718-Pyramimonas_sp.AAC.1
MFRELIIDPCSHPPLRAPNIRHLGRAAEVLDRVQPINLTFHLPSPSLYSNVTQRTRVHMMQERLHSCAGEMRYTQSYAVFSECVWHD